MGKDACSRIFVIVFLKHEKLEQGCSSFLSCLNYLFCTLITAVKNRAADKNPGKDKFALSLKAGV